MGCISPYLNLMKKYGLELFMDDVSNIENQYLNLIYHPVLGIICTREEYDKTKELMEWSCAICGDKILLNKRKYDVENFVCERCKETHNNKCKNVDIRILNSRTKLYKTLEDRLYQELEDSLNKGKGE